jgi:phosphomannomutase
MKGVSGIRGVVGRGMTPQVALDFTSAFATYLRRQGHVHPRVLLARDTRPTGEMMRHAVLAGLLAGGARVIELGVATTPTLQYAIPFHNADGAVCITASHNPVEWNALKFFQPNGMYLDKEQGGQVLALSDAREKGEQAFEFPAWDGLGSILEDGGATQRHLDGVLEYIDVEAIRKKKFKVVLDGCSGAGNTISPALIRELGCELIHINADLTGHFPHNPEPLNENLQHLAAAVKEHGADIGFAHDADADRVAMVTNEGAPIGEDYSLVWAVAHVLKNRRQGPVVTNLSTTMAVEAVAKQYNCETFRSPVGDVNVSGMMHDVQAVVGGEGNGGVILPDFQYGRDGIAALGLTLELLAQSGQTAADFNRSLPRFSISKATVDFQIGEERARFKQLSEFLKERGQAQQIDERDGVKLLWEEGGEVASWAHIRPSGTEPFVRVICEAKTETESARVQAAMREQIAEFDRQNA